MDKIVLEELAAKGLSGRKIAAILGIGKTAVYYWLNKYSIKFVVPSKVTEYKCLDCGEEAISKFYMASKKRCSICMNKYMVKRNQSIKGKIVDYKGGKCSICGYNKCLAALELHHLNPEEKDPDYNKLKDGKFELYKLEADKCVLLCANCHREVHSDLRKY